MEKLADEYLDEILAKKVDLLSAQQLSIIIAHILAVGLFYYISRGVIPEYQLLIFVSLIMLFGLLRLSVYYVYAYGPRYVFDAPKWAFRFTLVSSLSGILWGGSSFWFVRPDFPLHLIYVLMIYISLAASSLGALSPYLPAFVVYSIPLMGLISIKLLFFSGGDLVVLGFMSLIFLLISLYYSFRLSGSNQQLLLLGYENIELVNSLKVQKDLAENANRAKSRFLAAASHDLRQPLHAMGLYLNVLTDSVKGRNKNLVGRVVQSMHALEGLLNALLDISKLDAGIVEVHRKPIPLDDLFLKVTEGFRPQAEEKGLSIKWHPSKAVVYSDPVLLERIVRNFVSNAIRNTRKGKILLGARKRKDTMCLQVWDTGPGIPEKELGKIFEEFYQIENPERDRTKGLGLGLAIVNRMSMLLGHWVDVHSRPGKGSVFEVCVPISTVGIEEASESFSTKKKLARPLKDNPTILVIDDEKDIRDATTELLERWGASVVAVETQQEALEQLHTQSAPVDLILSDYRLREGQKGIEIIRNVQSALGYEPKAAIITGDTSSEVLLEVRNSGFLVLHKPLNPAQLRMVITRLLK
jgi:signal transduction histidine kinase/CheY-like chemotaxis protein